MNGWILIAVIFSLLALGCYVFDYRKIDALEDSLSDRTLRIYRLETKIRDLQNDNDKLRTTLEEHDSRIKEFEGDSYDE